MAVTFDAVGPAGGAGQGSTTSPLQWNHTCGASATLLIVSVAISGANGDSSYTIAATYNSVSMSSGAAQSSGASGISGPDGFIQTFYMFNPPTGAADQVSVTCTPSTSLGGLAGGSISFDGASALSTWAAGFGTAGSGSIGIPSTTSGNMCAAFLCDGTGSEAWTAGTQRFLIDHDGGSRAGNTTAATLASPGGTGTLSFTMTSDSYGILGVEIQAGSFGPPLNQGLLPNFPTIITSNAGWRGAGHSR